MIDYKDVQDFYDHGNSLDYDETLDVGIENPSSRPIYKVAEVFLWIIVVLGGLEVCHILQYFIPTVSSYIGLLVLIPAGLACGYVTSAMADYWNKRWELKHKETLLLHAAIRKAIWYADLSPLFPACNPSWLEHAYSTNNK